MGNHSESVGRRKLGLSDEWKWCKWEAIGPDGHLMEFGIPVYNKRGKAKWSPPFQRVIITDAEIAAEFSRYEKDTGKCGDCFGSGQKCIGWSVSGNEFGPCKRCNSTGTPPS